MLFQRIYDEDLAQASYFIGCQATGTAVVIDPRRDINAYLDEARRQNMRIAAVTETHIHADYLSGARELAHATGATLHLSDEGGPDWLYAFPHEPLRHDDTIRIGNITVRAVHTPGHTPEHLSFLVTDGAAADAPGYYLTGDFAFVGDVGRPDLLDEAAGGVDTRFQGARDLFASLREHFLTVPDYVQVWPGHGAGSACGKALGAVPSTTVGYERRFSWWAAPVQDDDEPGFTAALLEGQPDAPAYFARMKRLNRAGPPLLGDRAPLERLDATSLDPARHLLIDTRPREAHQAGAAPGSINLPAGKTFVTWAGWLIDPELETRDLVLLAPDAAAAARLRDALARVGIDRVTAYTTGLDGVELEAHPPVAPENVPVMLRDAYLLDVRTAAEHAAGHIPGAHRVHAGRLPRAATTLPTNRPILVYCQAGARSAAAASALRAAGFNSIFEVEGGYDAWAASAERTA